MKNKTDITLVLDRSGSMTTVLEETREGLIDFIEKQKTAPGEADFSMVMFDSINLDEVICNRTPIKDVDVQPIINWFIPRGSTPLFDCLGNTINKTGIRLANIPEDERPNKVIFVIITDGKENASRKFKQKDILDMIQHQREKYNWVFLYIGAHEDALQEANAIGISGNYAAFAAHGNTKHSYTYSSDRVNVYRSSDDGGAVASACAAFSDDEKEDLATKKK